MNPTPAVSWLLTVKNAMPYLRATLASIAAQTFKHSEIVVWVVESSDGTEAELDRWIPGIIPGRIFRSGPMGLGAARANLVTEARAELCACIDGDDLCEPQRLATQVEFLERNPDITLVASDLRIIDEHDLPTGQIYVYPRHHEDIEHGFLTHNRIGHPAVLMRRAAVLAAGNYDDRAPIEDYDLWLRLAMQHRFANLPDALVRYRVHSLSHTRRLAQKLVEERTTLTFANHAPRLFGIDGVTAQVFRERRLPRIFPVAVRVARHLAQRRQCSTIKVLRTPSFLEQVRQSAHPHDHFSRLMFAALDSRRGELSRAWSIAREDFLSKTRVGQSLRWIRHGGHSP